MKYPRTFHLPWSPGGTNDDKKIASVDCLLGEKIVITEKIDGSNICFTHRNVFARSHSGPPKHKSFNHAKAMHSQIKKHIPEDHWLFGEWCFALHDIQYNALPSFFLLFGVLIGKEWQSWNYVQEVALAFGLSTVPELYSGIITSELLLKEKTEQLAKGCSEFGDDIKEGVVVRKYNSFKQFPTSVAKWVRKDHPRNKDSHWMFKALVKQKLK